MSTNFEQFLNRNKSYLKMPRNKIPWELILQDAWNNLEAEEVVRFVELFKDSFSTEEYTKLKWTSVIRELFWRIEFELSLPFNDASNSWSRFDWMWQALHTFDISSKDFLEHLIQNKITYDLKMEKLPFQYCWYADGTDYDLGWFNKAAFEKENRELFTDEDEE